LIRPTKVLGREIANDFLPCVSSCRGCSTICMVLLRRESQIQTEVPATHPWRITTNQMGTVAGEVAVRMQLTTSPVNRKRRREKLLYFGDDHS